MRRAGGAGLAPFRLERYFAQHEFAVPYNLCASDSEQLSVGDQEPRFGAAGYDEADVAAYWNRVLERVADLLGVERAALSEYPPLAWTRGGRYTPIRHDDREVSLCWHRTTSGCFATAGIPFLRGRTYTPEEVATDAPVQRTARSNPLEIWSRSAR